MNRSEFRLTKEQAELLLTLGGEREVVGECKANILCIKRARPLWVSVTKIGDVTLAKATRGGRQAAQMAVRNFELEERLRQPLSEAESARIDDEWELNTSGVVERITDGLAAGLRILADEIVRTRKENEELRKQILAGTELTKELERKLREQSKTDGVES